MCFSAHSNRSASEKKLKEMFQFCGSTSRVNKPTYLDILAFKLPLPVSFVTRLNISPKPFSRCTFTGRCQLLPCSRFGSSLIYDSVTFPERELLLVSRCLEVPMDLPGFHLTEVRFFDSNDILYDFMSTPFQCIVIYLLPQSQQKSPQMFAPNWDC